MVDVDTISLPPLQEHLTGQVWSTWLSSVPKPAHTLHFGAAHAAVAQVLLRLLPWLFCSCCACVLFVEIVAHKCASSSLCSHFLPGSCPVDDMALVVLSSLLIPDCCCWSIIVLLLLLLSYVSVIYYRVLLPPIQLSSEAFFCDCVFSALMPWTVADNCMLFILYSFISVFFLINLIPVTFYIMSREVKLSIINSLSRTARQPVFRGSCRRDKC